MPVRIISPVSGEVVQTNTVPQVVRVVAIADSNLNTDVRFKLNGSIAGIDTSATTINVNGTTEYQYQFNIPVSAAGIQSIEVEDINQSTVPVTVRSTAQVSFELKLNEPIITLAKTATTLAPNLVTATVANRPTGSSVRFTLNGNVLKQDNSVPFNVSVTETGELKADLIVDGVVRKTATLNVALTTPTPTPAPTPTPTPTPTPQATPPLKGDKGEPGEPGIPGPKGDKGDKGDTGDEGLPGVKGDAGIPGAVGEKGDVGDRGLPGEKGEKGDRGEKGETGAIGAVGERGLPGERGITGDRGLPGATGERGLPGERGLQGVMGATGAMGERGLPGATGAVGERGLPGERGITGDRGLPGPKGDTGSIGLTGAVGAVGAVGSKGDKGDKGDTGSSGLTGARGVAGADGAIGPRGVAGAVGERGATGDRGLQGLQELQGLSAPVLTWSPWVSVPVIPSSQVSFSTNKEAVLRYRKREGLVQLLVDMSLTSFDKSVVIAQIPPQNLSLWMAGYGFHHPITFWVPAVISAGSWLPASLTIDRAGTVQVQAPVTFSGTAGHLKLSCLIAETPAQ